ncbi:hypothetical protein CUV01_18905 (plasmid) [Paracoccus tegillarcae]|uniref:Uncharacterized protein n=1 Tax=Paracoccus tegillarcae TaxID=1529068 RepID=A0A2K9EMJ0_9RHOB|nr:hypothetical protein CUV01_18905 [Paracoccus tegillarcae]
MALARHRSLGQPELAARAKPASGEAVTAGAEIGAQFVIALASAPQFPASWSTPLESGAGSPAQIPSSTADRMNRRSPSWQSAMTTTSRSIAAARPRRAAG